MQRRRGVVRCLLAALLFGASTPATSKLAGQVPSLELAGLLYLGAALAVLPSMLRHPRPLLSLLDGGRRLAVAVVFGGAVGPVLFVMGLLSVQASTASLLLNFELVATIVIAAVVFHEHLGRRLSLAVALLLLAGVLLVWQPGVGIKIGSLFVIGACVTWGIDNSATARIDQLSPEQSAFAKGSVAGTVNLLLGVVFFSSAGLTPVRAVTALLIGALGFGLSITLWVKGARDLGAARAQVPFAIAPFVGAVISWTVLAEPCSALQLLALGLAGVGIALSLNTGHSHGHFHPAVDHVHEHDHDDLHHAHHLPSLNLERHTHRHEHENLDHHHEHYPYVHHGHGH